MMRRNTLLLAATLALPMLAGCAPAPTPAPAPAPEELTYAPSDTPDEVFALAAAQTTPFGNEPAGFTPIVELAFGPQKLPTRATGPSAAYGVLRGKVTSAEAAARVIPGRSGQSGDYAHRCMFPKNTNDQAGKGVGCTFTAKENLPGNTDGNTTHSYQRYYERGYFRFGNLDAAGNIVAAFEEPSPGGMKLLGYWGVGFPGNANPLQLIGWWAPQPRGTAGMGRPIPSWTFQLSSQNTGVLVWDKYTSTPITAGDVWHPYEILFDAGTVDGRNGTAQVWIDGRLVLSATGLAFRTATKGLVRGWLGRHWNPVQGGGCGVRAPSCGRAAAGVLDVDDVYISVAQPVD